MARYQLIAIDKQIGEKEYEQKIIPICNIGESPNEKDKHELFEIDAITLSFPHLSDLLSVLKEKKCIQHEMYQLKIGYKHNKEDCTLDVVVNDSMLYKCALYCIQQKRNKQKNLDIPPGMPGFSEFVSRIFALVLDNTAYQVLTHDNRDKSGSPLVPYMFLKYASAYRTFARKRFLSPQEVEEYNQIKRQMIFILQKYKNLRGMRIWEKLYLEKKVTYSPKKLCKKPLYGFKKDFSVPDYIESGDPDRDPDEFAFYSEEEMQLFVSGDENAMYKYKR